MGVQNQIWFWFILLTIILSTDNVCFFGQKCVIFRYQDTREPSQNKINPIITHTANNKSGKFWARVWSNRVFGTVTLILQNVVLSCPLSKYLNWISDNPRQGICNIKGVGICFVCLPQLWGIDPIKCIIRFEEAGPSIVCACV